MKGNKAKDPLIGTINTVYRPSFTKAAASEGLSIHHESHVSSAAWYKPLDIIAAPLFARSLRINLLQSKRASINCVFYFSIWTVINAYQADIFIFFSSIIRICFQGTCNVQNCFLNFWWNCKLGKSKQGIGKK